MRYLIFLILLTLALSCAKKKDTTILAPKISYLMSPSTESCAQPFLFANKNMLYMSWVQRINDSIASLQYATLKDTLWSEAKEITRGINWFVNWADFPAIAENKGNLLSHYLQKSADGTYTYDIQMKLFNQDTAQWSENFILHTDATKSEHGFVTMLPYKNAFFTTWLDGRNTTGGHDHHGDGSMTIRAANVLLSGTVSNEAELDAKTCDCCQTAAAITNNGPIVVYRDRSDDEIRDIYITRWVDSVWTTPAPIFSDNWKIEGCPVNGPKATSFKNNLAIAWYTAAEEAPRVKVIFSKDNGISFNAPIIIDEIETIGRVDIAFINETNVLVSWVASHDGKTVIKAMKVYNSGKKGKPFVVAEFDPSRSSGFPQLEILNNIAYFAWTDVLEEKLKIKTAFLELDNL